MPIQLSSSQQIKTFLELLSLVLFLYSCQNHNNSADQADSVKKIGRTKTDTTMNDYLDSARDEQLDSFLDSLSPTKDTAEYNVSMSNNGRNFRLVDYPELRDATGNERGFVQPLSKYFQDILPFSGTDKKFLDLIAGLAKEALYLSHRSNFVFGDSGVGKPGQTGLAYSWGSKHIDKRSKPPGDGDTCSYEIYGLDCSGFIYQLFLRNKIQIPMGKADNQRQVTTLKKALIPYFGDSTLFQIQDLGKLKVSEMKTGDIIYFKNKKDEIVHIGICLNNEKGQASFYESSGTPNKCILNINTLKGVRGVQLDERIGEEGRQYSIVRIIPGS